MALHIETLRKEFAEYFVKLVDIDEGKYQYPETIDIEYEEIKPLLLENKNTRTNSPGVNDEKTL